MCEAGMRVAPFESCVACYRGDTDTGFAAVGEAELIIAALTGAAVVPFEVASKTVALHAERELGCDPGKVPVGQMTINFRLCRECARRSSATVAPIAGGELHGYRQDEVYGRLGGLKGES